MTIFSIVTEVCKVSFGILIAAICLKAACNMLLELKRVFWPDPIDTAKPARYRTKPTYATASQDKNTGNWTVKEDGKFNSFTVKKDFFPIYYERVGEEDE